MRQIKNIKKTFKVILFSFILIGLFVLGGCEQVEDVTISSTLHPFVVDIDKTPFGIMGRKSTPVKNYQMVIEEINFLVNHSGMNQKQYNWFVNNLPREDWFNLPLDEAYYPLDGDGYVTRERVRSKIVTPQARHTTLEYITSIGVKRVRLHTSVPSDWRVAIEEAISEWNDLGSGIVFYLYYAGRGDME